MFYPTILKLFALTEAQLVDLPLFKVKLLEMVFYSNKTLYSLASMLYRLQSAGVDIREIRPAVFTMMGFIINNKVIPKGRSIIFMHSNCKFCFKWGKFLSFQLL